MRKADAWMYSVSGEYQFATTKAEAEKESQFKSAEERWIEPLYRRTPEDRETLIRAANELVDAADLLRQRGSHSPLAFRGLDAIAARLREMAGVSE